jgi:hypothetical protein
LCGGNQERQLWTRGLVVATTVQKAGACVLENHINMHLSRRSSSLSHGPRHLLVPDLILYIMYLVISSHMFYMSRDDLRLVPHFVFPDEVPLTSTQANLSFITYFCSFCHTTPQHGFASFVWSTYVIATMYKTYGSSVAQSPVSLT